MKGLSLIFSFCALFTFSIQAQHTELEEAMADESKATVVVYRTPQLYGAARNWAIFADGERICKLSNKKYMIYQREPGDSEIKAQIGGVEAWPKKVKGLELPLEAGETYFVKTNVKASFTRGRVELTEVTERAAKAEMTELTLDRCATSDE